MMAPPIRPTRALAPLAAFFLALSPSPSFAQDDADAAPGEPGQEAGDDAAEPDTVDDDDMPGGADDSADSAAEGDEADQDERRPAPMASNEAAESDAAMEGDSAYGFGIIRLPDSAYPEPAARGIQ